ncbi:hypothetical protein VTK73DRAFT_5269 [Phialemonium thermophilum]|uniref:Glucose-methanol-choline oxidoreductase C-terminal domain-containing protein n=1 Tax=Phialemonium thermophilum TaxID=223376 RepID=A0ABR3V2A1_9PEZI
MVPYTILSNKPWRGGIDFKTSAARLAHFETFIALVRDRDTGSVHVDPDTGRPRVHYTPSAFDRAHALEGILALCRLCHASGAREIHPFLPEVEPFIRQVAKKNNDDDKEEESRAVPDLAFEAWLDGVRAVGSRTIAHSPFASAHQMGSCRMGSHPGEGVVDGRGRAWEARSLFVADASVFPSASGVNPMVTNMAIADWIARGVAKELAKGE